MAHLNHVRSRSPLASRLSPLLFASLVTAASAQEAKPAPAWSLDLQAYHYFIPDEPDFLLPMALADRGPLHLEARYNYEDRNTVSGFIGWNLPLGNLTLTPMAGLAVGQTDGIVPGLEVFFQAGRFEAWVEAEYLFDLASRDDDFFYAWSEASYRVAPWGALGIMSQRTKTFREDVELDWGLLARVGKGPVSLLTYLIDPTRDRFWMVGAEASF